MNILSSLLVGIDIKSLSYPRITFLFSATKLDKKFETNKQTSRKVIEMCCKTYKNH